jgi:Fur family ferric uptake transcriptional regulator
VSDALTRALKDRGLRLTAQRQLVLQAVRELGHATPDEVHAKVQCVAASVNLTTIYRTLELLEDLGLVTHAHLSHGAPTFHAAEDRHVHLVCRACGHIEELPVETVTPLAQTLRAERGFNLDVGHVALFGTCRRCQ